MIGITEYIVFFDFSTFRPLGGMSNWLISTFRPLVGRSKWLISMNIYWIFSTFRLFRPLGRRSKWSNLLKILNYFRLLDFSTSCWEVKIIDFTEYIGFFWLFGILLEGQLSDFYVYWILSTFRLFDLLPGGQNDWFYWLGIYLNFRFFDFSTSWWEVKIIDFIEFIDFFFWLFDFLTSWWEV